MRKFPCVLALCSLWGLTACSLADDPPSKDQPKELKKASKEEIDLLVEQLGDDEFAKRTQARNDLEAIGEPALGILKEAAKKSSDAEIQNVAVAIIEMIENKLNGMLQVFVGHKDRVNGVAISPDGKRALSASWDGRLRSWNLENGELIQEMRRTRRRHQ